MKPAGWILLAVIYGEVLLRLTWYARMWLAGLQPRALPWLPPLEPRWIGWLPLILKISILMIAAGLAARAKVRVWTALFALWLALYCAVNYSFAPAFVQFLIFTALAFLLYHQRATREAAAAGRFLLGAIFLSSAVLKLNSEYLSGAEFSGDGAFFRALPQAWKESALWQALAAGRGLPHATIGMEAALGLLALLGSPRLCWLLLLFPLTLGIFQPQVIAVYFCFLPFVVLVSLREPVVRWIAGQLRRHWHKFASIYALILLFLIWGASATRPYWTAGDLWLRALFCGAGIAITLLIFSRAELFARPSSWRVPRPWAALVTVYLLLGHFRVVPVPFGFSMFSGIHRPAYTAGWNDPAVCAVISETFHIGAWESRLRMIPEGCAVDFPNRGGLEYLCAAIRPQFPQMDCQIRNNR